MEAVAREQVIIAFKNSNGLNGYEKVMSIRDYLERLYRGKTWNIFCAVRQEFFFKFHYDKGFKAVVQNDGKFWLIFKNE